MPYLHDDQIGHLLRRAGFGARPDELETFRKLSFNGMIERVIEYERLPDDVDTHINQSGYVGNTPSTNNAPFQPNTVINDARQRWLFRMLHTNRPLQEKMTLFWHNHFATAYSKLSGLGGVGAVNATRYMAAKRSEDAGGVRGQLEMLRDNALGSFADILYNIATDTAMLYWLDGYLNTAAKPQENFGREIMELFTMGVGNYTEPDVYAAAKVFSGWNLQIVGAGAAVRAQFLYNPAQHDTSTKTFSFAVYPDGGKTIRARGSVDGMQEGRELIAGLAAHPNTARYLAGKLYRFFVSESGSVSDAFVQRVSNAYLRSSGDMKVVMREVLHSPEFWNDSTYFTRYSWPVEYVVRSLKDVGWKGFSVGGTTLTFLTGMGQELYNPPDVAGWDLGKAWFSTGSMLTRMNFESTLTANQRNRLFEDTWDAANKRARPFARTPEALVTYMLERVQTLPMSSDVYAELTGYLRATGEWTASEAQLKVKLPGLAHLITGSAEYQLI